MEHTEMVFVVMSPCKHKYVAVVATVNQMVVVELYAMIIVVRFAAIAVAQQHAQIVLVLDHVVHQQVVAVLRVSTYASRFKMKKKETK